MEANRMNATRLEGESEWARLGTLLSPLLHELRNELNIISLQTNILSRELGSNHQDSLTVLNRAITESVALLDWVRQQREGFEQLKAGIDLSAVVRQLIGELCPSPGDSADPVVTLYLRVPETCVLRLPSPCEIRQWLTTVIRLTLRMANATGLAPTVEIATDRQHAHLTLKLRPATESNDGRIAVRVPMAPLHPLERNQLDMIPHRLGFMVNNRLESEDADLTARFQGAMCH